MSVYRLCELSPDTAFGYAFYVSANTNVVQLLSGFCARLTLFLMRACRENLLADCLQGCFVVTCTLCAFISLVWLREQIVHGGAPQWLEQHQPPPPNQARQANEV